MVVAEPLSETVYLELAERELGALLGALDSLGDSLEVELSSGIVTIEFPDGAQFVINSHSAARQIWMAAQRRAWHFDYDRATKRWIASKSGDELWATLKGVLDTKLGSATALVRPA